MDFDPGEYLREELSFLGEHFVRKLNGEKSYRFLILISRRVTVHYMMMVLGLAFGL